MAARTKQRLGQHFLHDPAVIARIIQTIQPQPTDCMLEIGPGQGALTIPLLSRVNQLHVVELDRELAARLTRSHPEPGLVMHQGDALKFNYGDVATGPGSLRVVGNLPYNISTPLLFRLLEFHDVVKDMHLMLQREVVQRMAARAGNKTYGRLTVMLALASQVEHCFDIGPGAFRPPPQVWSSFVRLTPRSDSSRRAVDPALFARLVARAFSMRRKRISNGLKPWLTSEEIAQLGIDPGTRPEQLEPAQFRELADAAAAKPNQTNGE
jgi:16S rRNA (adenine1518-N6/adenine1519-N6)-dimethyltransferase